MFHWRIINSRVLQIAKALFRYKIWFMISEKGITRCTSPPRGARMPQKSQQGIQKNCIPEFPILSNSFPLFFTDMNMYILTEGRDFKKFLRENYAIALDSCYLFKENVEHGIEHDVDSVYEVCIH